jgi:hypothetical protein
MTPVTKFSLVLGQRLPWPVMQANAIATEAFGFDGLYLVDHFLGRLDINEPTHEGYTMLGAIAAHTSRVRLGLMVAGNTYRNPVVHLKQAIAVDHISGGRMELGVGAGWAEREHEAYGLDFPSPGDRVDALAEALEIWRLLQTQVRTTYIGKHYQIIDAPFEPKSLQHAMPVLIGGARPRMLRLVARYADIWNCNSSIDDAAAINQQLTTICAEMGRDPESIERTASPDLNLLGSVDAFREGVERFGAAGFSHITLPWPRVDAELGILQEIAANHLQDYRPNPPSSGAQGHRSDLASTEGGLWQYGFPHNERVDWSVWAPTLRSHPRWPLLAYLVERPGVVVSAEDLGKAVGIETHRDVTLGLAELAQSVDLPDHRRPWAEGPRGWSVTPDVASQLGA